MSSSFISQISFCSRWSFLSSELKKLKKLHLEQNEIWEIKDDDMFCDLPELLDLHLGDNQLSDINFSLNCLKKLRYLELEFNKIRNLNQETLEKLDKVFGNTSNKQIDLHGDPFTCDCNMNPLYDWLKVTTARLANKKEMRCYDGFPAYNAGLRIVNVEELNCGPVKVIADQNATSHHAVTSTLLGILIVLTATLIAVVLWINRITVREKVEPLFKNFKTSLQYSTIEKQDEEPPEVAV